MFPGYLQLRSHKAALLIITALLCAITKTVLSAQEDSSVGLTNFAFSSYLGTGFYTSSGQNVFVIQLPFEHIIKEKTDTEAGWTLNLPVTIGLINFNHLEAESLPKFDDVTTITFLPGIQYHYPVTADWTVIPFADYGFARDLNNTTNVLVVGAGIQSYANFQVKGNKLTLGNRFLYAKERSKTADNNSDYSLIETGLSYQITSDYSVNGNPIYANLYYINFYYPDNLVFFDRTENPIRVGIENEFGITFSNLPDFYSLKNRNLGLVYVLVMM